MTGYYIKIGYNPTRGDHDQMWEILKKEARAIANCPRDIEKEARRLGCPETCEEGCCTLDGFAENYLAPFGTDGHPLSIIERIDIEGVPGDRQIAQMASTDRGFKYHVRRAYVRLLIEAMHRHGIEVCLNVV